MQDLNAAAEQGEDFFFTIRSAMLQAKQQPSMCFDHTRAAQVRAARYNAGLLIKLTSKGVSFLFCLFFF